MPGSAASSLRRIAKELRSLPREWADDSVKTIRKAATKQLKSDLGGDAVMSNFSPRKLGVTSTVRGDQIVTATILPGPKRLAAAWAWLESGTKPHIVGGTRKGAQHPGTAAKRTWTKGTEDAIKDVQRDARRRLGRVMTS